MKLFYFILLLALFAGCKDEKSTPAEASSVKPEAKKSISDDSLKIILDKVKTYSENYIPIPSPGRTIVNLSDIPDSIAYLFRQLRLNDIKEYDRYITLLFLKLYRSHLECCKQGYELRRNGGEDIDSISDPLLFEFNHITEFFDNTKRIEFINSAMPITWIEKTSSLLNYHYIAIEYKRIEQITDSIQKDLYWND